MLGGEAMLDRASDLLARLQGLVLLPLCRTELWAAQRRTQHNRHGPCGMRTDADYVNETISGVILV